MANNRLITFLSDFGLSDSYVGIMKGVIAQINPTLKVIDLTHQIPAQNMAAARFNLMNSYPYFPAGTVHLAVVDPGVGSQRRAIAIQTNTGFLVGPDNGLFSGILTTVPIITAVELTNSNYWRSAQPSATFHGRDIFAPIAAHLASGILLTELGTAIDDQTLVKLPIPEYSQTENLIEGSIQYIDHFGNLVTNIPGDLVQPQTWWVVIAGITIPRADTYSDHPQGHLLALIGSHGWVEIAVNGGNAQLQLKLELGMSVQVIIAQ